MNKPFTTLSVGNALDCLDALRPRCVDICVTSPPYNLGISYDVASDVLPSEHYLDFSWSWLQSGRRVLKEAGSLFLNLGSSNRWPTMPHEVLLLALKAGFELQNTFHWVKSLAYIKEGMWHYAGHFKPLNSERYVNDCHEYIFHLTRYGDVPLHRRAVGCPYADKTNVSRWSHTAGRDVRCRGNIWFIPQPTRNKAKEHPATFPVELPMTCLKLHGINKKSVVLDPFCGSGSTGVAAKKLGAKQFIGFDLSPNYIEMTRRRIVEEV